uniref:Uncharacterized protein n=1 Tax=Neogobius melanostomus TaxID=47308 RepID=A0A8C6T295_9GOBI
MALSGKVALVTGAAMGIGRAMTEELLKNGAKAVLLDINTAAGKTLVEALEKKFGKEKTLFAECNVECEEQLKGKKDLNKAADTFGGIDIVCNNAGILNETEWEKMVSINLVRSYTIYLLLKNTQKLPPNKPLWVIVNTASLAGLGPLPSCPVYTATKHGIIGFTRAMALASLGSDYGVRFNALCPGFVETDLLTSIPERLGKFSHMQELTQRLVDNFGIMNVSQVAEGLMELLLDETKTGQALTIRPTGRKYVEFPSQA